MRMILKPDETSQLTKLQACLKNIKTWMTCNFLLLNSDKTKVIVLGLLESWNLGVIFDQDMSFNSHIKQIFHFCAQIYNKLLHSSPIVAVMQKTIQQLYNTLCIVSYIVMDGSIICVTLQQQTWKRFTSSTLDDLQLQPHFIVTSLF